MEDKLLNNWKTKKGFELMFNEYYESLCYYSFGIVKDYDVSEEIVQNLFVKLWDNRNKTPITTSLKSYLYRSAYNLSLNEIKHIAIKEKHKKYNKELIEQNQTVVKDIAIESELSETINKAIEQLPPERKKVFLMSREEGLKYREIAEKLNISIKTVENQMGKALAFLKKELSDYLPIVIISIILGIK